MGWVTFTEVTPEGRTSTRTIDDQGRVVHVQPSCCEAPWSYSYDSHGRLETIVQGDAASDGRVTTLTYDPGTGYLQSVSGPLDGHVTSYATDSVGRVTQQTRPDLEVIGFGYDANSNLTSLTPPGKPSHGFTYTPVDLMEDYIAPDADGGSDYVL